MYSYLSTTYYYVMDTNGYKTYILNDDWSFISFKNFSKPAYMITIGNSLYMSGDKNVWKVDQDLNILINYNYGGVVPVYGTPGYVGISYNPSNGLIYVVSWYLQEIDVFNLNLTLIRRLSTLPYWPMSIKESLNKLYVGTRYGIVLVYLNEIIINQFNGCNENSNQLNSILFDPNGYMATSCNYPTNKLYLFSTNGSFTGKSVTIKDNISYIGFDSKDRFIQISAFQISIFN